MCRPLYNFFFYHSATINQLEAFFVSLTLWCLFFTGVNAVLTVKPVDTNVTVGSHIRLTCSTDARKEVNWQYSKDDLNSVTDVYIANDGMGRQFRMSIRHKMDISTTIGRYDLLISNVTHEDDGFYICSEPGGWGTPPHARLTVTGQLFVSITRPHHRVAKAVDPYMVTIVNSSSL